LLLGLLLLLLLLLLPPPLLPIDDDEGLLTPGLLGATAAENRPFASSFTSASSSSSAAAAVGLCGEEGLLCRTWLLERRGGTDCWSAYDLRRESAVVADADDEEREVAEGLRVGGDEVAATFLANFSPSISHSSASNLREQEQEQSTAC
jgi:hypothetical protein